MMIGCTVSFSPVLGRCLPQLTRFDWCRRCLWRPETEGPGVPYDWSGHAVTHSHTTEGMGALLKRKVLGSCRSGAMRVLQEL